MAEGDLRIKTIMITMSVIVVILILSIIFISDLGEKERLFIVLMNALLISVNLVGFFMIWGSSGTLMDEVFVMTTSGMLLKHYTRRLKPGQDEHILAGMLTAIQNFIKDSFDEAGGRLREIRFENYDIMISYSENVVLAAVISTKRPQKLREKLTDATKEIERLYGHKLVSWDGDISGLTHIDSVMKRLLSRV